MMTTQRLPGLSCLTNDQPLPSARQDAMRPPYKGCAIRTLEELQALSGEWDDFHRAAGIRNLCQTHAWLKTWLRHFPPDELFVIVVRDQAGRMAGAAPLKISRGRRGLAHRLLRQVQFIGTDPTVYDWMRIAIHPECDENAVLSAMAVVLKKARWDILDLQFGLEASQLTNLAGLLGAGESSVRETMSMPYLDLPETVAEYEKVQRKKTRLEVNRHRNRFAKEFPDSLQLAFRSPKAAPDGDLVEQDLQRFFHGHIQYWAERGCKSDFQRFPALRDFYAEMLHQADTVTEPEQPRLMFSILALGEEALSYHLGFWQGNRYLCHLTTFNQNFRTYSPGTIHMDALVFESIRQGCQAFEFGRGDEPYKRMWTKTTIPLWNLRVFRNPISAVLWQFDIQLKKWLGKAGE